LVPPALDPPVLRLWSRPSWADLLVLLVHLGLDLDAQPGPHLLRIDDTLPGPQRFGASGEAASPGTSQRRQAGIGAVQSLLPAVVVLFGFLRAAIPQDPIALRTAAWALDSLIHQVRPLSPSAVGL